MRIRSGHSFFVLVLLLGSLGLAGCSSSEEASEVNKDYFSGPDREYAFRGEVMTLDTENNIAKIRHQDIVDWMGAMTMDFPVPAEADFAMLREGQFVSGTVVVEANSNYYIQDLQEISAEQMNANPVNENGDMNMDHGEMDGAMEGMQMPAAEEN